MNTLLVETVAASAQSELNETRPSAADRNEEDDA
jgi:hypothetical protein